MIRFVLLFALTLSACTFRVRATVSLYARPTHAVQVTRECPPLVTQTETKPAQSDSRSVWVAGHFRYDDDWVWIEGTWIVTRAGYTWEPPVCVVEDGNHQFHPGYFRPDDAVPPSEYREPGHIRMSCPADDEPADLPERIVLGPGVTVPTTTGIPGATIPRQTAELPDVDRPNANLPEGQLPSGDPNLPDVDRPTADLPEGQLPSADPNLPDVDRPTTEVPGEGLPDTSNNGQGVQCELVVNRVPAGGYVNIRGTGFTPDARVTISGNFAGIRRRSGTELVVRAAEGVVAVHVGEARYECGAVTLINIPRRR